VASAGVAFNLVSFAMVVLTRCERVELASFCSYLGEVVLSDEFSRILEFYLCDITRRFEFSVAVDGVEEMGHSVSDADELFDDVAVDVGGRILKTGVGVRFGVDEDAEFEDAAVLDGEGEVAAVGDGDEVAVLVLVLEKEVVVRRDDALEDSLHHEDELVVGEIVIVDGDTADVIPHSGFDDQFAG